MQLCFYARLESLPCMVSASDAHYNFSNGSRSAIVRKTKGNNMGAGDSPLHLYHVQTFQSGFFRETGEITLMEENLYHMLEDALLL